jgi:AcrR family transcriptional regulator
MYVEMVTRKYELKQRARSQEETRQRIVDATVALHNSIGPARTTISAIAERAGVQRLTVYRHFPDERSLFRACGGQWMVEYPLPDPARWAEEPDPERRLQLALGEIYAYFRATEEMTANLRRDLPELPVLQEVAGPYVAYWASVRVVLQQGWKLRGPRKARLHAVIGHAVEFDTWRSLARSERLGDVEAAELMVRLARAV